MKYPLKSTSLEETIPSKTLQISKKIANLDSQCGTSNASALLRHWVGNWTKEGGRIFGCGQLGFALSQTSESTHPSKDRCGCCRLVDLDPTLRVECRN